MDRVTEWLGLPITEEKVEGFKSMRQTFLGIELNTEALVLRLPGDKLASLRSLLVSWKGRRWCLKPELQSLAGSLQHAFKVARPGKTFLRRMFELLCWGGVGGGGGVWVVYSPKSSSHMAQQ